MKDVVATQSTTLNVRSKPEPDAQVIGRLQKGATVEVDPTWARDGWMKLQSGGYCAAECREVRLWCW